jgi:hypothetical protein
MKNTKGKNKNLINAVLTLTLTSVLQSCLPSSSDKPYADSNNQSNTCEARATASVNMSAADMQNNEDLFQDVTEQSINNFSHDADALETRLVRIDIAQFKHRLLNRTSNNFNLPLLNNKSVNVVLQEVKKYSDDNIVVTGRIENDQLSSVTIVINDNVIVANIAEHDKQEHYEIRFTGGGVHTVKSVTETDTECLTADGGGSNNANFVTPLKTSSANETTAMDAAPQIDVLVAYTPAALKNAASVSAMKALIQMGVADSNKAYQASGVNLSLRLVGILALSQAEASFSSDLSALKGTSDGKWDAVHAQRKRLGADLVAVVAYYPNSSTAGIGYVGSTYNSGFSITKTTSFKQYSFTHELGHNIGLNHTDGYENSVGKFRTVMAYGTYTRIPRFSNPSIDYNSYATGTSSNNSAKILNAYGAQVAAFSVATSQSDSPTSSDPITLPAEPCADGDTMPLVSE